MLILMIGIGIVATCMAGASRGSPVAMGLATSMIATVIPFVFFASLYWLTLFFARVFLGDSQATSEQASPPIGVQPIEASVAIESVPDGAGSERNHSPQTETGLEEGPTHE